MVDALNNPFVMHGAREEIVGGLTQVEQRTKRIELAVAENPTLAFALARTLIETVCRAVLDERNTPFSEANDLPRLFKTASQHLPFLPSTASPETEVRDSLTLTLAGFSAAIQAICELRNKCGLASHGAAAPRPPVEPVQALLAAEAAEAANAVVGFLHRIHRQDRTPPPSLSALYEGNSEWNDAVDEAHDMISICDMMLRPSKVLFDMEPASCCVCLADFDAEAAVADGVDGGVGER